MNAAQLHMASDRTRRILEDLEAVRENLLALSDDIWLGIDHNDNDAIEEGVRFKRAYNDKMNAFDELASDLSSMVQEYTRVTLAEAEEVARDDSGQNERIIQELIGKSRTRSPRTSGSNARMDSSWKVRDQQVSQLGDGCWS